MSTTELAALYDVKPATVAERLKEEGVRLRGNNLALDMFEVCRRYQEGHSPMQIADQLGCSYSAVRRRLDAWQGIRKGRKQVGKKRPKENNVSRFVRKV